MPWGAAELRAIPMVHCRERQDLIDEGKLLPVGVRPRASKSRDRIERRHHNWQPIAPGRVCDVCLTAQPKGEFDDGVACDPHES